MLTGWVADAVLRVLPILVFLTGITIVAELADRAGLFTSASGLAARAGRGSVRRLWIVVVLLA
ncbi:MAG: arsenic transporter, partial [bacterium]|nr:arsenic transporter [bacterium]